MQQGRRAGSELRLRVERARARHGWFDSAVRVLRRYSEDDGGFYAASLTYYTFFSIFPLLLLAASAIGYLTFFSEGLRERLLRAGLDAFPLLDSITSPSALAALQERRGSLALTGLVLALYAGSGAVVALGHALNRIARVEQEGNVLARRLASLKWIGVLGGAALLSIALGGVAHYSTVLVGDSTWVQLGGSTLGYLSGFAVGALIFATAFKFLPARSGTWREVLPGALIAGATFEILKAAGAWYMSKGMAAREQTFGAFAGAAGLLVASYLLAQATLLSAEVNAVLQERRATRRTSTA